MAQAFAPAAASSSTLVGCFSSGALMVSVAVRAASSTTRDTYLYSVPPAVRFASSGVRITALPDLRFARPAMASRRRFTAATNVALLGASSTRPHSTARLPRTPSASVENTSARSRRILRLSVSLVRPPVPGSTARSGASGKLTAAFPSSWRMISSHAIASS